MINAYEALAYLELSRGPEAAAAPGSGVTIGLLDNGYTSHSIFEFTNSIEETFLLDATDKDWSNFIIAAFDSIGAPFWFSVSSPSVAGIAAGRFGAYGADVKIFVPPRRRLDPGENLMIFEDILNNNLDIMTSGIMLADIDIETIVAQAQTFPDNGQTIEIMTPEEYVEQSLSSHRDVIEVLAQSEKQDKTILIWPAGDGEGHGGHPAWVGWPSGRTPDGIVTTGHSPKPLSSPKGYGGITPYIPELQGHSVAVVSVGEDGGISDSSNRCGLAAQFCIAAPGDWVLAAAKFDDGDLLAPTAGTSLSAGLVAGGLAVMKQLFQDQLSNEQLLSRLLATANDDGIYADSAIYGRGLMDLGAAANPWGTPAFMGVNSSATDPGIPITASSLAAGPALGDALDQALESQQVAAFDSLSAPFVFDAAAFTTQAPGASVASRLHRFLQPVPLSSLPHTWQFDVQQDAPAFETGHLSLTHGASRFSMDGPQGIAATVFQAPADLQGLTLSWTPMGFNPLTLQAGYLNEEQSLLGSHARGAFGPLSAETFFLGTDLNTTAGGWQLAAQGEIGQVNPALGQSQLIDSVSPLSTSAFRLQAMGPFANGSTLSFSLSQPLRVEGGTAAFSLPTGRTQDAVVLGKELAAPLTPTGRQLDLTAKLEFPWLGGDVSLGATRSHQPRHQRTAAPEWILFTGYRSAW